MVFVGHACGTFRASSKEQLRTMNRMTRALTCAAIASVASAGVAVPVASAAPAYTNINVADYYKLLVNTTPVYKGAGVAWGKQTTLHKGDRVTVTHKTSREQWYRIKFSGGTGYVRKSHLGAAGYRLVNVADYTRYAKDTTPVYNGAGTSWGKKRTLTRGATLRVTHKTNREGWYRVSSSGNTGYVWKSHFTTTKPLPSSSKGRAGIPAYSQTASAWKNVKVGKYLFGPSGCVPTSFAMVARSYGKDVTPLSVGRTMNRISDFNHYSVAGAGGKSIVAAGKYYGIKVTPLKSASAIKTALLKNKPVLGAMRGPSSIINYPYTHEVVLNGYKSGATTVTNPLGGYKRSYDVSTLWSWRSNHWMDTNAGGGARFWQVG
jgi:uncharacterized protein YgiM (DUF1202 family)